MSRSACVRHTVSITFVITLCLVPSLEADRSARTVALAQTPTPGSRPILLMDRVPDPKQRGISWFDATGHTLRGSFLDYWNSNGGLPQFGYPITEEFTEPIGPGGAPIMVQYFERARFEHHPENAGTPHEVLLGALGREFHPQDARAAPLASPDVYPPTRVYFNETGHNLGGAFLRYWNEHGGLAVNGYPISEELEEKSPTDGKTYRVQYFERSRFELHPENAGTSYEVLLGRLGTQLSEKKGYLYGWYPLYGHAADFSWVAGVADLYYFTDLDCNSAYVGDCSCMTFAYEQRGSLLQLDQLRMPHDTWTQLRRSLSQRTPGTTRSQVIFGRFTNIDEPQGRCVPNVDLRGYLPEQSQNNPATTGATR